MSIRIIERRHPFDDPSVGTTDGPPDFSTWGLDILLKRLRDELAEILDFRLSDSS